MFSTKLLSDLTSAALAPCQAVTTWRMFALLSVYPINMIKYADNPGESRERITPGMTWSTLARSYKYWRLKIELKTESERLRN